MDSEALCEALASLSPSTRRRIIDETLASGYAVKDIANLMGVSSSAVSRYIHGTLLPSSESLCRLLTSVEDSVRDRILKMIVLELWKTLRLVVGSIRDKSYSREVVEYFADEIARLLEELRV